MPSVASRGDSYENIIAESMTDLFKTKVIPRRGPPRGIDPTGSVTEESVVGSKMRRLAELIEYMPPPEHEALYFEQAKAVRVN